MILLQSKTWVYHPLIIAEVLEHIDKRECGARQVQSL